jgi:hypothetical protein
MRTLVEVSAATGIPLESLTSRPVEDIATYVEVLAKKPGRRKRH